MRKDPHETFKSLAMPLLSAVWRAAVAMAGQGEADDLVQQTYLKAWQGFGRFAPGTNVKAWLMRILRNNWIDRLRHDGQVRMIGLEELDPPARADDAPPALEIEAGQADKAELLLAEFSDQQVLRGCAARPRSAWCCCWWTWSRWTTPRRAKCSTCRWARSRAAPAGQGRRCAALQSHARDLGFTGRMKSCT